MSVDALRRAAKEKRAGQALIEAKLKKIERKVSQSKKATALNQHKHQWHVESKALQCQLDRCEGQVRESFGGDDMWITLAKEYDEMSKLRCVEAEELREEIHRCKELTARLKHVGMGRELVDACLAGTKSRLLDVYGSLCSEERALTGDVTSYNGIVDHPSSTLPTSRLALNISSNPPSARTCMTQRTNSKEQLCTLEPLPMPFPFPTPAGLLSLLASPDNIPHTEGQIHSNNVPDAIVDKKDSLQPLLQKPQGNQIDQLDTEEGNPLSHRTPGNSSSIHSPTDLVSEGRILASDADARTLHAIEDQVTNTELSNVSARGFSSSSVSDKGSPLSNRSLESLSETPRSPPLQKELVGAQYLERHFADQLSRVDTSYVQRLKELDGSFEKEKHHCSSEWESDVHFHFKKIYRDYVGLSRRQCLSRMMVEIRSKSKHDIEKHYDWYTRVQFYQRKRESLITTWTQTREDIVQSANRMFQSFEVESRIQRQLMEDIQRFEERRMELHGRLEMLREDRCQREQVQAELEEARRTVEEVQKREQESRIEQERKRQKEMVAEYNRIQEAEVERQGLLQSEQEALARQHAELMLKEHKERVTYRKGLRDQKLQSDDERRAAAKALSEQREQRLAKIRAQVKVEAERDPDRLVQPTQSSAAEDVPVGQQPPFAPVYGYSMKNLLEDARFRLTMALRDAGLDHNSYAKEMISKAVPSKPPRLDNFTSDQIHQMYAVRHGMAA